MAASPAPPPPGGPSRLHNFGMAPGGSVAGEVPVYTQLQSLRKDDAEVIAEREWGSRCGVSVPLCVTGPTTAVVVLRLDRAASQFPHAGPRRQEDPERSHVHCAEIASRFASQALRFPPLRSTPAGVGNPLTCKGGNPHRQEAHHYPLSPRQKRPVCLGSLWLRQPGAAREIFARKARSILLQRRTNRKICLQPPRSQSAGHRAGKPWTIS